MPSLLPVFRLALFFLLIPVLGFSQTPFEGINHAVIVRSDGSLWTWGLNENGQLGDGTTVNRELPTLIGTTRDWQSASVGWYHSVAIKQDGSLWAWGGNPDGQLGTGTRNTCFVPTRIGTAITWKKLSTSGLHTMAVRQDGSLWAWGSNKYGQLGDGTTTSRSVPTRIGSDTDWVVVSAGWYHTVALKQDGSLWAWGHNSNNELGDGTTVSHFVPTRIGTANDWQSVDASHYTVAVKADGSLWGWGPNGWGQLGVSNQTASVFRLPTRIGTSTNWLRATAGYDFTVAIQKDGSLWNCGVGYDGQLGHGVYFGSSTMTRVGVATDWHHVSVGHTHTVATRRDGSVWAWGNNYVGQVGSAELTCAYFNIPYAVALPSKWLSISGGPNYSMGIRQDGTLWAWGTNQFGQLGTGSKGGQVKALTRIGVGASWRHVSSSQMCTMGIQEDGSLWVWGSNTFYGQMGIPAPEVLVPTRIGTASWQSVSLGAEHTVAVRADGSLWAWGRNIEGQIGDGTFTYRNTPTRVGFSTDWQQVSAGQTHTLALRNDGTLWAWGDNSQGQLGTGSNFNSYIPVRVGTASDWINISAGNTMSLAVRQDGTLWAWGKNSNQQLGDSIASNQNTPIRIGSGTNWKSVSTSFAYNSPAFSSVLAIHSMAIQGDGSLWAWGLNDLGQLGEGSKKNKLIPTRVGVLTSWQKVSAAPYHTLAIRRDSTLWGWGDNGSFQVGQELSRDHKSAIPLLVLPAIAIPTAVSAITSEIVQRLELWPNPAINKVQLRIIAKKPCAVRLLTSSGKVIRIEHALAGDHQFIFSTTGLPRGLYLIQVQYATGSISRHLVLE